MMTFLASFPLGGGGDFVVGGELQGVDYAEHFVEVPSGGHWVDQDQFDFLVGADHEYVRTVWLSAVFLTRGRR